LLVGTGNVRDGKAGFMGDIFETGALGPGGRRENKNYKENCSYHSQSFRL
jgi:hypothetical protein